MKNSKIIGSMLVAVIILIVCRLYYNNDTQEKASFSTSFNIRKLTQKEYEEVGRSQLNNPVKDDFRKAVLSVDFQHTGKIKNRKITVPTIGELKEAINSYEMDRYWFSSSYEQDNESEDIAEYTHEFVFYSKGLNNNDIKTLFSGLKINASWLDSNGNSQKESCILSEIINFTE